MTLAIVGQGSVGRALARALRGGLAASAVGGGGVARGGGAGALGENSDIDREIPHITFAPRLRVIGPVGRGADGEGADAVLLCVPDEQIARAAALISPGRLVGHCSGATGLEPLAPHEAFSLHPLMTVTDELASFAGAGAAIDGSTPRAVAFARELAEALGLRAVRVAPEDRALYHAAASMASNFLVTLEATAERLAAETGVNRDLLVPLVEAAVANWAALGPEEALTGPVARGDEATIARQREAIAERAPESLELFDALVDATRSLAGAVEVQPA